MSADDFLGRWSRRKRQAQRQGSPAASSQTDGPADVASAEGPTDDLGGEQIVAGDQVPVGEEPVAGGKPSGSEVDLSLLPPIDSITAVTDVTAFLREGVPLELTRAALRRAWSADPAIRDFVGLAENAWDFNDPNAMPGFGPLDCSEEQLRELVAKVIGDTQRAVEDLATEPSRQDKGSRSVRSDISPEPEHVCDRTAESAAAQDEVVVAATSEQPAPDAAAQPDDAGEARSEPVVIKRREHGGALPR